MLDVGRAVDGELVKGVELVHVFKALASMAGLLGVEMRVWRGKRDRAVSATVSSGIAGRTARTGRTI